MFEEDKLPATDYQSDSEHSANFGRYLILTPCSSSASRCLFIVLLDTIIMEVDSVERIELGGSHMGRSVHLVRCGRHSNC